jgi:hypothetical protein
VVVLAGGLSLIPVGLYLMLFPGPTRWIGLLDAGMLVIGVALVRADRIRQDENLSLRAPPPSGSTRPSSP